MESLDLSPYAAIFFAGGHGTMWDFRDSPAAEAVLEVIREQSR